VKVRVYKPTYKAADGSSRVSTRWAAEWRWQDRVCRAALFTDKGASVEAARRIGKLADLRAAGEGPDPDLSRWIESSPAALRAYLARVGMLDARRLTSAKPLTVHLADWKAALLAKGATERHVGIVHRRASRALTACGFRFWGDVRAEPLAHYLAKLKTTNLNDDARTAKGASPQTVNFYAKALRQFARWMLREGRATENPLAFLEGVRASGERRRDRRAFAADELRALLDAARSGPQAFGMSGPERAVVYQIAAETGLRAGELRSLTRADLALTGDTPTVRIRATVAKNRREDTLPLRPETAAMLAEALGTLHPAAQAFALPPSERTASMLRADLEAARAAWLNAITDPAAREQAEQSDRLRYRDSAGRFADFHALRHSFVSFLAAGGVSPKAAQRLARHSDVRLTLARYTHLGLGDEARALDALPDFTSPSAIRATGTMDTSPTRPRLARHLACEGEIPGTSRDLGGRNRTRRGRDETPAIHAGNTGFTVAHTKYPGQDLNLQPSVPKTDALSN
jgi:integrase